MIFTSARVKSQMWSNDGTDVEQRWDMKGNTRANVEIIIKILNKIINNIINKIENDNN